MAERDWSQGDRTAHELARRLSPTERPLSPAIVGVMIAQHFREDGRGRVLEQIVALLGEDAFPEEVRLLRELRASLAYYGGV